MLGMAAYLLHRAVNTFSQHIFFFFFFNFQFSCSHSCHFPLSASTAINLKKKNEVDERWFAQSRSWLIECMKNEEMRNEKLNLYVTRRWYAFVRLHLRMFRCAPVCQHYVSCGTWIVFSILFFHWNRIRNAVQRKSRLSVCSSRIILPFFFLSLSRTTMTNVARGTEHSFDRPQTRNSIQFRDEMFCLQLRIMLNKYVMRVPRRRLQIT